MTGFFRWFFETFLGTSISPSGRPLGMTCFFQVDGCLWTLGRWCPHHRFLHHMATVWGSSETIFFSWVESFLPMGNLKRQFYPAYAYSITMFFFVNKYVKLVCTIYVVFRGWMCEKWTSCNKLWESVLGQKPTTERELRQCFYPFQPITDCLVNKKVSGRIETVWTFLLAKKTGCSIHLLSQQQRSGCCARQDEFSSWAWKWAKSFGVCLFPWRKHTHNI